MSGKHPGWVDPTPPIPYHFREIEVPFRISELNGEETPMRMDADRGRIRSFSWRNWFAHGA
ncbi:hypothetical protein GCM10023087_12590 [Microbacterium rhizosphaerae]